MTGLRALLIRKIAVTAVFWCIPLLTFPPAWFAGLGVPAPAPLVFVRLLGAAYLALLVGYYQGLKGIEAGHSPLPVLRMGIAAMAWLRCCCFTSARRASGRPGASARRHSCGCRLRARCKSHSGC